MIITNAAKQHLIEIAKKKDQKNIHLSLLGGGCAGFKYNWSDIADDKILDEDRIIELDDERRLIVDSFSIFYIANCTIDYEEGFTGSNIVIKNPAAVNSCGCGDSVGF